jgi:hypothetical protein
MENFKITNYLEFENALLCSNIDTYHLGGEKSEDQEIQFFEELNGFILERMKDFLENTDDVEDFDIEERLFKIFKDPSTSKKRADDYMQNLATENEKILIATMIKRTIILDDYPSDKQSKFFNDVCSFYKIPEEKVEETYNELFADLLDDF